MNKISLAIASAALIVAVAILVRLNTATTAIEHGTTYTQLREACNTQTVQQSYVDAINLCPDGSRLLTFRNKDQRDEYLRHNVGVDTIAAYGPNWLHVND